MADSDCRPLNIALVSYHGCPVARLGEKDTGGMNVYVSNLAKYLGELGHKVDVFTRFHDISDPIVVTLSNNVNVIHLNAGPIDSSKLDLPGYVPEFVDNLMNYTESSQVSYDLIHSHYWLSGLVGDFLNKSWNIPHISTFHTLAKTKLRARSGESESELRFSAERNIMQSCDRILVLTESESNDIRQLYNIPKSKISVIPAGVDIEMFTQVPQGEARRELGLESGNILLYVGRIDPIKGLDLLLESVGILSDHMDINLIIVGGNLQSDKETQKLRKKVEDLNLSSKVTLVGSVPQEKLPYYYSAAELRINFICR